MSSNIPESYSNFDYTLNVYLFHVILIAPVIIFVGFKGLKGCKDEKSDKISDEMFNFIMGLGILTLMYHFIKLIEQLRKR